MEFVRMLHCGCKKTTKRISMHCFFKLFIFGGGGSSSLVVVSGGYSPVAVCRLLPAGTPLIAKQRL